MKISKNKKEFLREWVEFLCELDTSGDDADIGKIALFYDESATQGFYMLYEPGKLYKYTANVFWSDLSEAFEKAGGDQYELNPQEIYRNILLKKKVIDECVIGTMITTTSAIKAYKQMDAVASRKGEGAAKFLYGIAMQKEGAFIPSRDSCSKPVLQFYAKRAAEGYGHPLDKMYEDDFYNIPNMPWLDYYYEGLPTPWSFDSLVKGHQDTISRLVYLYNDVLDDLQFDASFHINEKWLSNQVITFMHDIYFNEKYIEVLVRKGDVLYFNNDRGRKFTRFKV